jgi:chromosome segregation ATPase
MTQLALFDERTRKDLEQLQYDHAWLTERLETAKVEYRKLRAERDTLTTQVQTLKDRCVEAMAQHDQLRREHEAAQRDAQHWKAMAAAQQRELTQAHWEVQFWKDKYGEELAASLHRPRATPTPEALLKKLLTLAHPDKWSQGQPATALAHELTVLINDVRATLEGPL